MTPSPTDTTDTIFEGEDSRDGILTFYENEAQHVPIFGSLREISLSEHIDLFLPKKKNFSSRCWLR